MAVLDPKDDCIVIRVVYDGAPMAGKTTSVAALGRGLGTGVYSPGDLDGRTLYFDWLDYTGGLFEGRRIRCQIVSVPGQATLAPRRRRLLESADVVVFVGDSSPAGFEADRRYLGALNTVLQSLSGPPVGIVLQANKRDLPDAVPLDRLRTMLDEMELRSAIIESVALEGSGIRETFVFAVRLALDRVRELMRNGELSTTQPKINSAQELLAALKEAEDGALDLATESGALKHTRMHDVHSHSEAVPVQSLASQAFQEAMRDNTDTAPPIVAVPVAAASNEPSIAASSSDPTPAIPDEKVASGLVWPPVIGRVILHEITQAKADLQRADDGSWSGVINGRWRLHSINTFDHVDAGRNELVNWARLHAASVDALSKDRCIVLAADGRGRFRLWQIVRVEPSLRSQLDDALTGTAQVIANSLLASSRSFLNMAERLSHAACDLQLTLDNVGLSATGPIYLGFMPQPSQVQTARHWSPSQATELLFTELTFAQPTLRARRSDLFAEMASIARSPENQAQGEWRLLQRLVALAR